MNKLLLDSPTIDKFLSLDHGVELCDPSGRSVGWFLPATGPSDYNGYECPLSDAELVEIERQGGGRSLADILRDLDRMT